MVFLCVPLKHQVHCAVAFADVADVKLCHNTSAELSLQEFPPPAATKRDCSSTKVTLIFLVLIFFCIDTPIIPTPSSFGTPLKTFSNSTYLCRESFSNCISPPAWPRLQNGGQCGFHFVRFLALGSAGAHSASWRAL